jgi:hypothetical protein
VQEGPGVREVEEETGAPQATSTLHGLGALAALAGLAAPADLAAMPRKAD